jgi:hypothetical protein
VAYVRNRRTVSAPARDVAHRWRCARKASIWEGAEPKARRSAFLRGGMVVDDDEVVGWVFLDAAADDDDDECCRPCIPNAV